MAWFVAPLIMGAAQLGMTALNKPKKYQPDTSYIDKYMNNLKSNAADTTVKNLAMRSQLQNIGANTQQVNREIGHNAARTGMSGSGVEAQQRLSVYQGANKAIGEATNQANIQEAQRVQGISNKLNEAVLMKEQMLAEARQRNRVAEDQWKSQMVGAGINAAAGLATAGVTNAMTNKAWGTAFNAATQAGALGGASPQDIQAASVASETSPKGLKYIPDVSLEQFKQMGDDPQKAYANAIEQSQDMRTAEEYQRIYGTNFDVNAVGAKNVDNLGRAATTVENTQKQEQKYIETQKKAARAEQSKQALGWIMEVVQSGKEYDPEVEEMLNGSEYIALQNFKNKIFQQTKSEEIRIAAEQAKTQKLADAAKKANKKFKNKVEYAKWRIESLGGAVGKDKIMGILEIMPENINDTSISAISAEISSAVDGMDEKELKKALGTKITIDENGNLTASPNFSLSDDPKAVVDVSSMKKELKDQYLKLIFNLFKEGDDLSVYSEREAYQNGN